MDRYFFKEDIQTANKHIKRFSTSLIIEETEINTTVRDHFTPTRKGIIKSTQYTSVDEDSETMKPSYVPTGKCKTMQLL